MQHEYEKLITIVELGSFSRAAEHLRLSQPALTIAIQQLEKKHGVDIFESRRPIVLSEPGAIIYESALRFRSEQAHLSDNLKHLGHKANQLRVGSIDSFGLEIIQKVPDVASIVIDNSTKLVDLLLTGEIDVCVITSPAGSLPQGLQAHPIKNENFCLIAHPEVAKQAETSLQSGVVGSFLSYNPESTTHRHMLSYANKNGVRLNVDMSSTSPELLLELVRMKRGVALLPQDICSSALRLGSVVELGGSLSGFKRPLVVVFRGRSPKRQTINELITLLTKVD